MDATSGYWAKCCDSGGTVMKVPTGGGTPATLASGQGEPICIAFDATSVYWTNGWLGEVWDRLMKLTPK